jgi:tRNA(Ile2) C34 agmatinyltransferase TiaS
MSDTCIRCGSADAAPGALGHRCPDCIEEIATADTNTDR